MWQFIAAAISIIIAAAGLFFAWQRFRDESLRRNDVLEWANAGIETLQTLVLIGRHPNLFKNGATEELRTITLDTSVLVEKGRLFFKNEIVDSWGSAKPEAYRGYRPLLLDQLVRAHQIACRWHQSSESRDAGTQQLAEECAQNFVSLVQKEVGRSSTACVEARRGGDGVNLDDALMELRQQGRIGN